jgi:hypothetical protein
MPNVSAGIEVEGQSGSATTSDVNSDAGFNSALADAAARSRESDAPAAAEPSGDASTDSTSDIQRALMAEEAPTDRSIASGLEVDDSRDLERRAEAEMVHARFQAAYPNGPEHDPGIQAARRVRVEQERAVGENVHLRNELAVRDFDSALENGVELSEALLELRRNASPDAYKQATELLTEAEYDEQGELVTPPIFEEWEIEPALDSVEQRLLREQLQIAAEQQFRTLSQMSDQVVATQENLVRAHFKDSASSDEDANRRIVAINNLAASHGEDLTQVLVNEGPHAFLERLTRYDAEVMVVKKEAKDRQIQQAIIDTPSTDVQEGLEQLGPNGYQPLQPRELPDFWGPDAARSWAAKVEDVRGGLRTGRLTAAEMQRAFREPTRGDDIQRLARIHDALQVVEGNVEASASDYARAQMIIAREASR